MRVDIIAGARPNFIKVAALIDAIEDSKKEGNNIHYRLIHTGQHYDRNMSGSFFEELCIPEPHFNIGAGGGSQAEQTAAIMIGYEKILNIEKPDICIVVGDVTSTMACSICAQKGWVKVAHVEAGIRSWDWKMPEEINRIVTDSLTDYFFTTTELASNNLLKSGIPDDRIFFVGNTMIDTLLKYRSRFKKPTFWDSLPLSEGEYLVLTLHRPSNVDDAGKLSSLLTEIISNSSDHKIIFPVHPRTLKVLNTLEISDPCFHVVEPLSYLEFNYLVERCKAVITDSGGITEETTVLHIPCMTLRDNTERPETISVGTNELLGTDNKTIKPALNKLFEEKWKKGSIPELWDGSASKRIINILLQKFGNEEDIVS